MYIPQKHIQNLENLLTPAKVVVIYGARRVGKTTLVQNFIENRSTVGEKVLFVNGDDVIVRQQLESQSVDKLRDFVGDHSLLVVDEAQYVETIRSAAHRGLSAGSPFALFFLKTLTFFKKVSV